MATSTTKHRGTTPSTARSQAFAAPSVLPGQRPAGQDPIDPATAARLARLQQRTSSSPSTAQQRRAAPAASGDTRRPAPAPTARTRKRHAAKGSRAAALMMSVGTTVGLAAFFQHASATGTATAANTVASSDTASSASTPTSSATTSAGRTTTAKTTTAKTGTGTGATAATTAKASTAVAATTTGLADGSYTGATQTNRWGPVQVQITVSGGKITAVDALQTPSDRQKSVAINAQAVPMLNSEAVAAQSATIHSVSGATYTSTSYRQSLQSAIDQAKAAATTKG